MNPELIDAVKERISLGHSKDKITAELKEAGYNESVISAVFNMVSQDNGEVQRPLTNSTPESTHKEQGVNVVLPEVTTLLKRGFSFAVSRFDLVILLFIPYVLVSLITYDFDNPDEFGILSVLLKTLSFLVAIIINILNYGALLFITLQSGQRRVSYLEALQWAWSHVGSLAWIGVLVALVIYGGLMLLIIPGIIVATYIVFSQYVFVNEGLRGMESLLRSRSLMQGNWWAVWSRFVMLALILLVAYVAIVLIFVMLGFDIESLFEEQVVGITAVPFQVLSAFISVVMVHVLASLYLILSTVKSQVIPEKVSRWKYITLAWIGVITTGFILMAAILLSLNETTLKNEQLLDTQGQESSKSAKERAAEIRNQDSLDSVSE